VEQAILTGSGLRPASLDAPVAGDTERCLHEIVGAPDAEVDMVDFRASIEPMIAAQSAVVREILTLRFASDCTQAEIAARLGASQLNVSRVLRGTLDKFRRALLSAG
jgi:RNA polymerase sigma-B factor